MVHYPLPKYVKKTELRRARDFAWTDAEKRADHVALHATCMRCAQSLCKLPKNCNKPDDKRCDHCKDGNRGGCTLVPTAMNGRLNRLYQLRDRYQTAVAGVANVAARKNNAGIKAAGLKLARCQKQFNLELANRRRVAAHSGTPMGVATQVPTTSPQYLGLILAEQRRIATALEALVPLAQALVGNNNAPNPGDSDSDTDSEPEGPGDGVAGGNGDDSGDDDGDD